MENLTDLLPPILLTILLIRLLFLPMKWALWAAVHAGCGFSCLWLVNSAASITGIFIPINAITVLVASFCGLPGIGLLVLLELWPL